VGFPFLRCDKREQRVWFDTSAGFEKEKEFKRYYGWLEEGAPNPLK
jgi:hypothetical protein